MPSYVPSSGKAADGSLRDTLVARLASLPNAQELGLTVLSSTPKRTSAVFPHSSPSVRCWEMEFLVVVHSAVADSTPPTAANGAAVNGASAPPPTVSSSSTDTPPPASGPALSSPPTPRVLAAAISAHLYTLPTPSASSILYISKVDSSGYAPPGPVTRVLAAGVLAHFLSPLTRPGGVRGSVSATLFARSQGQYLFPNSSEGGGKRVLGGLGLCQWWKGVYEDAARLLVATAPSDTPSAPYPAASVTATPVHAGDIHLSYLLPSYAADEARGILGAPRRPLPTSLEWTYAPPFGWPLLSTRKTSLATLIPSLPDDPKTRFLEELVSSAHDAALVQRLSKQQAPATPLSPKKSRSRKELDAAEDEAQRKRAHAALAKVPLAEFWERMGFRQECSSGDVTGFFSIRVASSSSAANENGREGEGEGEGEDGEAEAEAEVDDTASLASTERSSEASRYRFEPLRPPNGLPKALVERILTSLLNTDFGTRGLAYTGTESWLASTRSLVVDEIGEDGWAASTATIAPKASAAVSAVAMPKRKEESVTMLMPRKKKRA